MSRVQCCLWGRRCAQRSQTCRISPGQSLTIKLLGRSSLKHGCTRRGAVRCTIAWGTDLLHEHRAFALSWQPCGQEVMARQGVGRARADQCQPGQQNYHGHPIKKPTGFMSNDPEFLQALGETCFCEKGLCSRPKAACIEQSNERVCKMFRRTHKAVRLEPNTDVRGQNDNNSPLYKPTR